MARIKYNVDLMKYMSVAEKLTRARIKDCIEGDPLIFVTYEGEMGKAIGKKGVNIKKVESVLKKKVKFIEFNENVSLFVKNYLHPLKVQVQEADSNLIVKAPDAKTRGQVFGREKSSLIQLQNIVKRFFQINEIKVE